MPITLQNFRDVLGKKNDGNVQVKSDGSGLEKTDYGFFNCRSVASVASKNIKLRTTFLAAIANSPEGRRLSAEFIQRIRERLKLPAVALGEKGDLLAEWEAADTGAYKKLSRREVKVILGMVDAEVERVTRQAAVKAGLDAFVRDVTAKGLDARGQAILSGVRGMLETLPSLKDVQTMALLLPRGEFNGFSVEAMGKFLNENEPAVMTQLLARLFRQCQRSKAVTPTEIRGWIDNSAGRIRDEFRAAVTDLMVGNAKTVRAGNDVALRLVGDIGGTDPLFNPGVDERTRKRYDDLTGKLDAKIDALLERFNRTGTHSAALACLQAKTLFGNLKHALHQQFVANVGADPDHDEFELSDGVSKWIDGLTAFFAEASDQGQSAADAFVQYVMAATVGKELSTGADAINFLGDTVDSFLRDYSPDAAIAAVVDKVCGEVTDEQVDVAELAKALKENVALCRAGNDAPDWGEVGKAVRGLARAIVVSMTQYDEKSAETVNDLKGALKDALAEVAENLAKDMKVSKAEAEQSRRNRLTEICGRFLGAAQQEPKLEDLRRLVAVYEGEERTKLMSQAEVEAHALGLTDGEIEDAKLYYEYDLQKIDEVLRANNGSATGARDMLIDRTFDLRRMTDSGRNFLFRLIEESAAVRTTNRRGLKFNDIYPAKKIIRPDGEPVTDYAAGVRMIDRYLRQMSGNAALVAKIKETTQWNQAEVDAILRKSPAELTDVESERMFFICANFHIMDSASNGYPELTYFPTADVAQLVSALRDCGITAEDFGTFEGRDRIVCLAYLSRLNPRGVIGLRAFCETYCGKPPEQVTFADIHAKRNGLFLPGDAVDYLAKEKKEETAAVIAKVFRGDLTLEESGLSAADRLALLKGLEELGDGAKEIALGGANGCALTLSRDAHGALSVTLKGLTLRWKERGENGEKCDDRGMVERVIAGMDVSVGPMFSPDEFIHMLRVSLARQAKDKTVAGEVRAIISKLGGAKGAGIWRKREICSKALAACTGKPTAAFAGLTLDQIQALALDALADKPVMVPDTPSETFMSAETVELHRAMREFGQQHPGEIERIVRFKPSAKVQPQAGRPQDAGQEAVRRLAADLLMNADTWAHDEEIVLGRKAAPGVRLQRLLRSRWSVLETIGNVPDVLGGLSPDIRTQMRPIFERLRTIQAGDRRFADPATLEKLADIEKELDKAAKNAMAGLQRKVTALFAQHAEDHRTVAEKTLSELSGADGLDPNTPSGKLALAVLNGYFTSDKVTASDRRKWLSEVIAHTNAQSSDAQVVAELLKGAGPLLQKLLQGLPTESFNPETQAAIRDMKSRLPPIPEEAVRAQLLEMVRSSGGRIKSITVVKSLGAASVGQAFLCRIQTPDHPNVGEECVIKLLRPNAGPAIERERMVIEDLLKGNEFASVREDFRARYERVLDELDLTKEAENVDLGISCYETPSIKYLGETAEQIHSMRRIAGFIPTTGAMVVRKAEGQTVDSYFSRFDDEFENLVSQGDHPVRQFVALEPGGERRTIYRTQNLAEFVRIRQIMTARKAEMLNLRNRIVQLTQVWMENALYGNGFFHGDLHAGNIMFGDGGLTLIDFGNCTRLSADQQSKVLRLLINTLGGNAEGLYATLKTQLSGEALATLETAWRMVKGDVEEVLAKGDGRDVIGRLHAAFALLQRHGVTIPPVWSNFVASFVRLGEVVSELDEKIGRADGLLNALEGPPIAGGEEDVISALPPPPSPAQVAENVPVVTKGVFQALRDAIVDVAGGGTRKIGIEEERHLYDGLNNTYMSRLGTGYCGVFEEIRAMGRDRALAALNQIAALFEGLRQDDTGVVRYASYLEDRRKLVDVIGKVRRFVEATFADNYGGMQESNLRARIGGGVMALVEYSLRCLAPYMRLPGGQAPDERPFSELICSVVFGHQGDDEACVKKEFGLTAKSHLEALGVQAVLGKRNARFEKLIWPKLCEANATGDPADYVGLLERMRLRKAVGRFCPPRNPVYVARKRESSLVLSFPPMQVSMSVSLDESPVKGWGKAADKRKAYLDELRGYLGRLGAEMGGELQLRHIKFALRLHSAIGTPRFGASFIGALATMADADYNQLLSEAQFADPQGDEKLVETLKFMRTCTDPGFVPDNAITPKVTVGDDEGDGALRAGA